MTFTEKRAQARSPHQTALSYAHLEDTNTRYHPATTINCSPGGLLIETDTACRAGAWLHLRMAHHRPESSGPEAYRSYTAEVKSCLELPDREPPRFGIGVSLLDKMQTDVVDLKLPQVSLAASSDLRRKAEQYLFDHPSAFPREGSVDIRELVHDLRVHQIELETQNEELRQAQQTLSTSMTKYANLYDFAPVGYFTFDADGIIVDANLSGSKLLQVERRFLNGTSLVRFVHPADLDVFRQHHQVALTSEISLKENLRLRLGDGSQIQVRLESIGTSASNGSSGAVFTAMLDITSRLRAEAERRRLEKSLARAHKLEAVATLAGGIAHDINNALMGIQGSASLIELDLEPGHAHLRHLDRIEEMVQRSAHLIKQLLGFAGGGKYQVLPIDLNSLILSVLESFASTRTDLDTAVDLKEETGTVSADPHQLEQVLINLFLNAYAAMPQGGRLSVTTKLVVPDKTQVSAHMLEADRYVCIAVSDTGVGMDKNTQQKIFDPFFTTHNMAQCTGMGLASVYGIISNHHGFIEVKSQPKKGTTFYVYLPVIHS